MYRAPAAGGFTIAEQTTIETFQSIVLEFSAGGTQLLDGVMGAAIIGNHHGNGFTFAENSGVFLGHHYRNYDTNVNMSPVFRIIKYFSSIR